ncbi:iron-containing alcohol dehydrogenase [Tissierella sp. MSJ-40]|uniref:Iron-containing alcohol dehydrogenase n=1 Tax=Tissierella simiarum TaxID=2841534 RepID=A0ABS6EAA0_9FIRM|nr:iron-containing alcohol dehydrogenase [Tissierella simiarum]MBU5439103.1 iron-containing alcohol dehydrogenase [Tissierella simiarum]
MNFSLNFPSNLIFGPNSVEEVGEKTKEFGEKCIIVTGKNSTKKSGALDKVLNSLSANKITSLVFNHIVDEPNTIMVDEVRKLAEEERADFIIGLGGGSPLDVAKAAAGLYGQEEDTLEYLNKKPFEYKGIPFIAIPTTSGTGSEITLNSVLYNSRTNNKASIAHPKFQSRLSIVDPILTYSMSPEVTASSGMDALTHAIESYTSKTANPVTKALAGEAIRLIGKSILKAVHNGNDSEARTNMALASTTAGLAFAQTGVGVAHAISHPLGAIFEISHGVGNAILLSPVIDFNDRDCHEQYVEIGKLLGGEKSASSQIKKLLRNMPIPQNLTEAGYKKGKEDLIIEKTYESRSLKKNPRQVNREDILEIIEKCL